LTERQVPARARSAGFSLRALATCRLAADSSLVSVLTVLERTKQTQIFATNLGSWVIPGAMCAGLYLLMSLPLSALARQLERRWKAPTE
jgi:ABC-type amino acid transport system permease subunit